MPADLNRTEQRDRRLAQVKAAELALEFAQIRYREGMMNYLNAPA